jgi:hypothetical protein
MTLTRTDALGKLLFGKVIRVAAATVMVLVVTAAPARAQATPAKVELGVSLANLTIGLGDNDFTTFGVPSSFFGLFSPGVYASIFATPNISIDPRVGLMVISGGGDTEHLLNLGAQVNYFTRGTAASSPFLFGDVGLLNASDEDSITTFGGGAGYRWLLGDRLALRGDARFTHYSDGGGNSISVTLSLGGLFGNK